MTSERRRKTFRDSKARERVKNIETKRFYCEKCNKVCYDNGHLQKHFKSKIHTGEYVMYRCAISTIDNKECLFSTKDKRLFHIHLNCKKHGYGNLN